MEQQEQTIHKTEERRPKEQRTEQTTQWTGATNMAAQAILAGSKLADFPPNTLEELAARLGNSGMLALLSMGAKEPQQAHFFCPADAPDMTPYPVPVLECPAVEPSALTAGAWTGEAFDPSGLIE
ncbi:MAG: hypothetical protein LUC21_07780 [Oscillospiraceae bacterium]|nr:hypothetical protein [Oscillospiraceae bacterium]MCD8390036.1 hypothetical protein [Oscillospiraceae bacterium]